MRSIISRWFLFGLLVGWSLTHATVFAQQEGKTPEAKGGSSADKVRAKLEKAVTLDFAGNTVADVLNHFRDKTGIAISVDQGALMQMGMNDGNPGAPILRFTIKATNEKASQVLRRFLNTHQLAYIHFEDGILVTSEESALLRQMRQRVSVDLDDVPFSKAVRSLAKNHGVNLVIDPKVLKLSEVPVSLQLDNTGIETAVRLLAELANLKAVRMGNVMFITSEERAKRIREEEPQQFDNPLNPNLPIGPGILRGGAGFGGFGGAMALPSRVVQPVQGIAPPPPLPR